MIPYTTVTQKHPENSEVQKLAVHPKNSKPVEASKTQNEKGHFSRADSCWISSLKERFLNKQTFAPESMNGAKFPCPTCPGLVVKRSWIPFSTMGDGCSFKMKHLPGGKP